MSRNRQPYSHDASDARVYAPLRAVNGGLRRAFTAQADEELFRDG